MASSYRVGCYGVQVGMLAVNDGQPARSTEVTEHRLINVIIHCSTTVSVQTARVTSWRRPDVDVTRCRRRQRRSNVLVGDAALKQSTLEWTASCQGRWLRRRLRWRLNEAARLSSRYDFSCNVHSLYTKQKHLTDSGADSCRYWRHCRQVSITCRYVGTCYSRDGLIYSSHRIAAFIRHLHFTCF